MQPTRQQLLERIRQLEEENMSLRREKGYVPWSPWPYYPPKIWPTLPKPHRDPCDPWHDRPRIFY